MNTLGIAQQGLDRAQGQFDQSAQRISQATIPTGQSPPPADSVSLSDAAVSLMSAGNQYGTEVAVAHTAAEMQKATLSLLA
jgi:hypothetical protein